MTDPQVDTTVPHSARVWNYLLGGTDNFAVDREAAEYAVALMPELVLSARANRQFLGRAVRFLAGEARIHQFLDVGTGLPTADNTHEVAQAVAPEARIVYADNDPLVLIHARKLLTSTPQGATTYLEADVRDPQTILRTAAGTLDFTQPIAVVLSGILNFVIDDAEAHAVVTRFVEAVPSGSHLLISHPTTVVNGPAVEESMRQWNESGAAPIRTRTVEEISAFFDGLEILDPGVVTCTAWRPDPHNPGITDVVSEFVAVGRKP
ncbi:SAM-dependent methyltransferase [Actinoplanes sp. NPDC026670]|uniref:SAM-dependent methyltransferase n=1 Tax=Actinoplanes sp. NPDC026670 TaxID=3154700 RepID=UPI0033CCE5EA